MNIKSAEEYKEYFSTEKETSHQLLGGEGSIIISAPHSVSQLRNGKIKVAERETGVLARLLHDELNCPVIFKTKNVGDDANYDEVSAYKEELAGFIKSNKIRFLIDLHQLSPTREVQIDLGAENLPAPIREPILNAAISAFHENQIQGVEINKIYDGSYPHTVSSFVSRTCHIPAIQIEMNTALFLGEENRLQSVFEALKSFILAAQVLLPSDMEEI